MRGGGGVRARQNRPANPRNTMASGAGLVWANWSPLTKGTDVDQAATTRTVRKIMAEGKDVFGECERGIVGRGDPMSHHAKEIVKNMLYKD